MVSDRCKCSHLLYVHEIKPGKHEHTRCTASACGCTVFRPNDEPQWRECPTCGARISPIEAARKEERG